MTVWRAARQSIAASAVLAVTSLFATRAAAQATPAPAISPLVVSVHVIDSTGIAIEGADVAVLVGLSESKATGTTDPSGHVALTVTEPRGDYQLVVRKIGYNRSDQFFRGAPGRLSFDVVMHRNTQALAPVRVTAREDLKRKSYFIDADEIAKHADELIDASDILKKLKPDMVCGRSCSPWGGGVPASVRTAARSCPISTTNPSGCRRMAGSGATPGMSRTNAWVNGQRILMIATDPVCMTGKRGALSGLPPGTMQVLCEILPEHIEQIQFIDEFDNSIGKVGSNSALFIVLKEGVVVRAREEVVRSRPVGAHPRHSGGAPWSPDQFGSTTRTQRLARPRLGDGTPGLRAASADVSPSGARRLRPGHRRRDRGRARRRRQHGYLRQHQLHGNSQPHLSA